MILLYGAVDDPRSAVESFDDTERGTLVVLEAHDHADGARTGIPCIGRSIEQHPVSSLEQALREQDAAVRRIMSACTIVPFRFQTVVSGTEEFHRQLDGRSSELADLLVWLRARVELAVRARCTPAADPPVVSGRSYLASRRDHEFPSPLADLHQTLLSVSVAATAQADGPHGMKGSYLLERGALDVFTEKARVSASGHGDITGLSVTGPWAPYSFVTGDWARRVADG